MKLHYFRTSPYVRKVCIVAHEAGIAHRLELIPGDPDPPSPELLRDNPLSKIPCLITAEGERLFDSRVICEYLDHRYNESKLFPSAPALRWPALRWQALGDGMLDALLLCRCEALRPEAERSSSWVRRQKEKVERSLDVLESEAEEPAATFTIGQITIACALGYLDLRFADWDWRERHGRLAAWYDIVARRASLKATAPV